MISLRHEEGTFTAVKDNPDFVYIPASAMSDENVNILNRSICEGFKLVKRGNSIVLVAKKNDDVKIFDETENGMLTPLDPYDIREFTESGLVLLVNQFLHIFGFCLSYDLDEKTGITSNLHICRTKFRGFSEASAMKAYKKISNYMLKNADTLKKEAEEE